jgi:hypothetical protein
LSNLKNATMLLVAILIVSLGVNVYLVSQNALFSNKMVVSQVKLDMVAVLNQAQVSIQAEVKRIGDSLIYASEQLSSTGISGSQADAILSNLAANSSFIINAATENLDNIIVAVQPANWSIIGKNVGQQNYLNPNPYGEITPVMSPVIPLQSGMNGNSLVAPIFDSNKELIGVLSVIFDPSTLIKTSVLAATAGKPYELIGMQLDGLMVYDSDPAQQWNNLFTSSAYANYPSLVSLGHQIVEEPSGYGTYNYNAIGTTQLTQKECFWTTISAYGQEWRLTIVNSLTT